MIESPDQPAKTTGREALVRCRDITQFFGGVRALASVSLDLYSGEVLGLVGENGAGKSTLTKILSGLITPDQGEIWFGDTNVPNLSPRMARRMGVETVYQNLELCDNLTPDRNVMLGQEPVRFAIGPFRWVDYHKARSDTIRHLAELGVSLPDMDAPVRRLSGGQRQAIAIARASVRAHRLMMFDEPTAALGLRQKRATLDLVRRVAEQGVAVLIVSHNLEEVMAVADRIVALRLGQVTLDTRRDATTRDEVERHMSGFTAA
jgi:ABC-type sugar transport system ATPase subunit